MTKIVRSGQAGSFDNINSSQSTVRTQVSALVDAMRQLAGNPEIASGSASPTDPLNAPFTLYVDPYIGSDRFVAGEYNNYEAGATDLEIIANKLRRIDLQRLECGYTQSRPFKTLNRAAIEAAIITSRNWYTYSDPRAHADCVTIVLSGGVHTIYNDPGSTSTSLASWGTAKDPTIQDLIAFNPVSGGLLLPRGCSVRGLDLRKTSARPSWVPAFADEAEDYGNRRAILKISGTGFFFDFTVMDKVGLTESVHLLDPFQPASQAELDTFYAKIDSTVGGSANLASGLLAARPSEYQIVGPIDQSQSPSSTWDTTTGSSPYIFNVSVRSEYGMSGAFWDGSKLEGLKSMVCANFTGTNQQKDMRCWQVYENSAWTTLSNTAQDYQKYINADPDNIRRHPARQTRHIAAIENAYIQKVSIFGIGQSNVTMVDSGGEITDNGGNSTFGGCSAIAKGYKGFAFAKDKNWTVSKIKAPLSIAEKTGNIRRIELGVVASISSSSITLTSGLAIDAGSTSNPAILETAGYTLAENTRIWIDNPSGADWSTLLSANAWSSDTPAAIGITAAPLQSGTLAAAGNAVVGRRVYIRRLVDTRNASERRCSLLLSNTTSARMPQRNAVLQTDPNRSNGAISRLLTTGGEEVLLVTNAGTGTTAGSGVNRTAEVTIRRGSPSNSYAANTFYRQGAIVKYAGKHWQAKNTFTSVGSSPDPVLWGETFVHMPSDFNPEESITQEAPILVLDTDLSNLDDSTTLGIQWPSIWASAQYRTGTDYLGVYGFLRALGFSDAAAHAALIPQTSENRERDPSSAIDFPTAPAGGAATGRGNWAIEFRRPSTIRLYGHQWEWAGFGNYSKAMPAVQQDMSEFNRFTYYFTNSAGGRVIPKGSNEDGYEITPRGLEDIATGATIDLESLGGQTIDESQVTNFPNGIQAGGESTFADIEIGGNATFGDGSIARTSKTGVVKLAGIDQLTSRIGDPLYQVESESSIDAGDPEVVTIGGLNLWRQSQRLISAATGVITVYVQAGATDRTLDQMFENPPATPGAAIPTLARAAEYANALIGGGNQTAEIRIAQGLYDPASIWECNVVFMACDSSQSGWPLIFPETNIGNASTDNNFFDGSGHADIASRVNFQAFTLLLRDNATTGNQLHVNVIGRQILCRRGVDFRGGFHFLGVPHLIKAVANGDLAANQFLSGSSALSSSAYTSNLSTNVDNFLSQLRSANNRAAYYDSWTTTPVIQLEGQSTDVANIRGIVFGPALPSRKESLDGVRAPYIATNDTVRLQFSNIYLRGNTTITSAGMGVTNSLPLSGSAHYGSTSVTGPWTWRQHHHTFIGPVNNEVIYIDQMGGKASYKQGTAAADRSWFKNNTKYLPNHIHLTDINGLYPANSDSGPFFDQFIHAKSGIKVRDAFQTPLSSSSTGSISQGFYGKFGSNGYNSVKTRGVVLGNEGILDEERSATVFISSESAFASGDADNEALTIFKVAGLGVSESSQILPRYESPGNNKYGEPYPDGYDPVPIITTGSLNQAGTAFALNMGLRSYSRGISPEYGFTIKPNAIL